MSEKRLSLTPNGNVRDQLKTPYRDGTTHVIFEPLDFLARLAALVPMVSPFANSRSARMRRRSNSAGLPEGLMSAYLLKTE